MIESFQQFERPAETPAPLQVETESEALQQLGSAERATMEQQEVNNSSFDSVQQVFDLITSMSKDRGRWVKIRRIEIGDLVQRFPASSHEMCQMPPTVVIGMLQFITDFASEAELQERVGEKTAQIILEAREKGETCFTLSEDGTELRVWAQLMEGKNIRNPNHIGSFGMNKCIASLICEEGYTFQDQCFYLMREQGYTREQFAKPGYEGVTWPRQGYTMTRYRYVKAE